MVECSPVTFQATTSFPSVTLPRLADIPHHRDDVRPTLPPLRASQPASPTDVKPTPLLDEKYSVSNGNNVPMFHSPAHGNDMNAYSQMSTDTHPSFRRDSHFTSDDYSVPHTRQNSLTGSEESFDSVAHALNQARVASHQFKRAASNSPRPCRRLSTISLASSHRRSARRGSRIQTEEEKASKSVKEQQSREDISAQILHLEKAHKAHGYRPSKRISTPNKMGTANRRGSGLDQTKVIVLSVEVERQHRISSILAQTHWDFEELFLLRDQAMNGDVKVISRIFEAFDKMHARLTTPLTLSTGQTINCLPNDAWGCDLAEYTD